MAKKHFNLSILLFLALTLALFVTIAVGYEDGTSDPAVAGPFNKCSYTSNLSDSDYASAEMFYPCDLNQGPYSGSTLTGGYTNTKEDMEWLSTHLATHGFIVIAMTPTNVYGNNPVWERAHKAGILKLISENDRSSSPIYGRVDTSSLQIMGFSKGGGGALLASSDVGANIAATQALAPYMDSSYDLSGIRSATICYTGTNDSVASPDNVVAMYNSLPDSIDRTLAYFDGPTHYDWFGSSGNYRNEFRTYITSWMKVYLDGNVDYSQYIQGDQDWFYQFAQNEDTEGGCGGCD